MPKCFFQLKLQARQSFKKVEYIRKGLDQGKIGPKMPEEVEIYANSPYCNENMHKRKIQ